MSAGGQGRRALPAPTCVHVLLAIGLGLVGCSGDDDDGGGDPDAGVEDVELDPCGFADAPAALVDVGERVDRFHGGAFARIEASVRAAPAPAFHEVVSEDGECRHYQAAVGFCDPPCAGGDVCTIEGSCEPYPELVSAGTLHVEGIAEDVAIDPEDFSPGTYAGPGGLPGDLFAEQDVVVARFEGDVFPATTLRAMGVVPVDAELTADGLDMLAGQDLEIAWTTGADPDACVQVVLNGFNETHGAPLSDVIRCESADDGSIIVPSAMVDAFPTGETPEVTEGYDWPHSELTRYTRSTADTSGGSASLVVRSSAYFLLRHSP